MTDEMGILEGIATTRAIRRYRDDPIPEEDLNDLLFAATRAPSGSNRQGFRFLVLRDGSRARQARALPPDDVFIAATVTLGVPVGGHGRVRRRPLRELVFEDRWGKTPGWVHDPPGSRHTAAGPPAKE